MRLAELHPEFLKIGAGDTLLTDASVNDCDGIFFLCPKCFEENHGPEGTHRILCWKPHVPLTRSPGPGRWEILGTNFENLTLRASSSSVFLSGGCEAHFFINDGEIQNC